MAEAETKFPVKTEPAKATPQAWGTFGSLRHEIDRLFEEFDRGPFRRSILNFEPFWRSAVGAARSGSPAVDVVESDKAYEITAELPGIDEKDIEVKLANGNLTIKGEKHEEKEEKKKDYYLQERRFGSFERTFRVPEGIDGNKIEANFKKGVLTVTLPKTPEAQKAEKTIAVKSA